MKRYLIDPLHPLFRVANLAATVFWSIFVGIVFVSVQNGVAWLYFSIVVDNAGASQPVRITGTLISLVTIAAAVVCSGLVLLLLRNTGVGIRDWLGLKFVSIKQMAGWILLFFVFSVTSNLVASYFQQDMVTDFARNLYESSSNLYLLGFAVVVAAPLFEEIFFRGFMLFGISRSRFGVTGAILITAVIWTAVHAQYDWYIRTNILMIGILFGYARHKSGSLLPSLTMHGLMNAMALIEVAHI